MHFLRKTGLWLALLVFSGAISLFTFSFIATQTFGKPEVLKGWLVDADVYDNFITITTDQIRVDSENGDQQNLVDNETLKDALKVAFKGDDVQVWVEDVIDGTYTWLNKQADKPEFTIDFSTQADIFIAEMANRIEQKYNELPVCQSNQQAQQSSVDPLNADCKEASIDSQEIKDQIMEDLQGEDGIFEDTVFTQDDLKIDPEASGFSFIGGNNEELTEAEQEAIEARKVPFYQKFENAPDSFSLIKLTPWLALGLAVLIVIPIIFLASTKKAGVRRVGWRLISGSVVSLLGAVVLFFGTKVLTGTASVDDVQEVQDIVIPFVSQMFYDLILYSVVIAGVLLILGIVIVVVTRDAKASKDKESKAPVVAQPKAASK